MSAGRVSRPGPPIHVRNSIAEHRFNELDGDLTAASRRHSMRLNPVEHDRELPLSDAVVDCPVL